LLLQYHALETMLATC